MKNYEPEIYENDIYENDAQAVYGYSTFLEVSSCENEFNFTSPDFESLGTM